MQTKDIMAMSRPELIDALRSYAEFGQFKTWLHLPTAHLRGKLAHCMSPEHEKTDGRRTVPQERFWDHSNLMHGLHIIEM